MLIFNKFKKKTPIKESQINIDKAEQLQKDNIEAKAEQLQKDNIDAKEEQEYEIVEKEILPEKMICPDCGGITLVGLDFCDKCGGELINHDN